MTCRRNCAGSCLPRETARGREKTSSNPTAGGEVHSRSAWHSLRPLLHQGEVQLYSDQFRMRGPHSEPTCHAAAAKATS
eukprot:3084562-Amphidinium_carterae.1